MGGMEGMGGMGGRGCCKQSTAMSKSRPAMMVRIERMARMSRQRAPHHAGVAGGRGRGVKRAWLGGAPLIGWRRVCG
jgi:hypothetical protein